MKIFSKRFLTILLCCMCFFSSTVHGASYKLLSWNLVDSGKHLDWDGSTKFMTEWYNSVNTWNAYKKGVIRVDRWNTLEDVKIMDKKLKDGSVLAETYPAGKIVFYIDAMERLSFVKRQSAATHEIGHALGLDHNKNSSSVMRAKISLKASEYKYADLDIEDKLAYDEAYTKY